MLAGDQAVEEEVVSGLLHDHNNLVDAQVSDDVMVDVEEDQTKERECMRDTSGEEDGETRDMKRRRLQIVASE